MNIVLDVALFSLVFINILLHVIGFCILLYLYKKERNKSTQKIYFINLSISEAILNLMEVLKRIPEMASHDSDISTDNVYNQVQHYATLINLTGVWVVIYLTMIYVTIDRVLFVRLSFKYIVYWTKKKAKCLIHATWGVCVFFSFGIAMGEAFLHLHYQDVFYKYFYPTIDFLYIVLVVSGYSYIFYRYQKSYKAEHKYSKKSVRKRRASTTQEAFQDSRFYTTILLVFTFLIFIVIPDLTYMFFGIGKSSSHQSHHENRIHSYKGSLLFDICRFSYAVASTIDFFIYIFLQPAVKGVIRSKCRKLKRMMFGKGQRKQLTGSRLDRAVELHPLGLDAHHLVDDDISNK